MKIRMVSILLIIILAFTGLTACKKEEKSLSIQELLDLGEKYLLELDYEQAVVQFLKAIEIEPMNPRGYTGAAEAYIGLNESEKAYAILNEGLKALPDNEKIQNKIDELHSTEQSGEPIATETDKLPTETVNTNIHMPPAIEIDGLVSDVHWDTSGLCWDTPDDDTMIKSYQVYYRSVDAMDTEPWIHSPHRGYYRPPNGYNGGGITKFGIAGGSHEEGYIPVGEYFFKVVAEAISEEKPAFSEMVCPIPLTITREPETIVFDSLIYDNIERTLTVYGTFPIGSFYFWLYDGMTNTYNDWIYSTSHGEAVMSLDDYVDEEDIVGKTMVMIYWENDGNENAPIINIATSEDSGTVVVLQE